MQVYEGNQPYIFVSYAHKDQAEVLPILEAMKARGFRIWYDSGIEAGTEWPEFIAEHLLGCDCFLAFLSPRSAASENCRNEINLAVSRKKKILIVYLEDTTLSPGLELQIGTKQSIYLANQVGMASFIDRICEAPLLADSKGEPEEIAMSGYSEGLAYTLMGEEYTMTGLGDCQDEVLTIPPYYEGLPVTAIGEKAFEGAAHLIEIIIPDTVKRIGKGAFDSLANLANVSISNNLEVLEPNAFERCESLTFTSYGFAGYLGNKYNPYLILARSDAKEVVTGLIHEGTKFISKGAFVDCDFLSSLQIPAGVTSIAEGAFVGCGELSTISVDKANTTYHTKGNCLIETSTKTLVLGCQNSRIPQDGSVVVIGKGAFRGCTGLTQLVIPEGVAVIGEDAFDDCLHLSAIAIPKSVRYIGDCALQGCLDLVEVKYPGTLAEWHEVKKGWCWNNRADFSVIYCLDGKYAPSVEEDEGEDYGVFSTSHGMWGRGMDGNMKMGLFASLFLGLVLLVLSVSLLVPALVLCAIGLLVLSALFALLGYTPKTSKKLYFRGKETNFKKSTIVYTSVAVAAICLILGLLLL